MSRFDTIVLVTIAGLIAVTGGVIALGQHAGLGVASLSPQDGSQPPATSGIRVTFSSPMDTTSVEASFSLSPTVGGSTRWDGNTFIFTPTAAFTPGQTYTATFAPGAQSVAGRRLTRTQSWSFTPRVPGVLYLSPASGNAPGLWLLPAGGQPQELYAAQYSVADFAPSADGSQIAMTLLDKDQLSDIWLIDASGKNLRQITHCGPGLCGQPTWSPDGRLIAYERQEAPSGGKPGPSRIWLYDVASGSTSAAFEDQQVLGLSPVWSPDGSRLAFYDASAQAIQVLTVATGKQQQIPNSMGEVGSFAPDGSSMAYADIREVGPQFYPQVWLADLTPGGGLSPLRADAQEDQSPEWSPDGRWVAFASRRLDRSQGFGSQMMLYNVQTDQIAQITGDAAYNNTGFRWSPSGDRLLVQRFDLNTMAAEVWAYDASTGKLTKLVGDAAGARWLP